MFVASLVLMGGCAGESANPTTALNLDQDMSKQQQEALADNKVTNDEYHAGYAGFSACMTRAGYPLIDLGESHEVIQYSIPAAAVDAGADVECYTHYFEQLDIKWQVSRQDDSYTADVIRRCLTSHNIAPAQTLEEMLKQLDSQQIEIDQCLED